MTPHDRPPRVSICIPTYRSAPFLRATLDSVRGQTFRDFELIIVDDQSPDDSYAIAERFVAECHAAEPELAPRIRLYRNPANLGAEGNWNRCLELAEGQLIKLLCGDDLLYPNCIERQVAAFDDPAHADVTLVTSARDFVTPSGRSFWQRRPLGHRARVFEPSEIIRRIIRSGTNPIGEPSVGMFRRPTAARPARFDDRFPYVIDLDFWLQILRGGKLYYTPELLASFRVSRNSWSFRLVRQQAAQVRALFAEIRRDHPAAISRFDFAIGLGKITAQSYARQLIYPFMR